MTDTVIVQEKVGGTKAGSPVYGKVKQPKSAMVWSETKLIKDPDGVEVQTKDTIVTETAIALTSRIWIRGADTSDSNAASRIINIGRVRAPTGYELFTTFT